MIRNNVRARWRHSARFRVQKKIAGSNDVCEPESYKPRLTSADSSTMLAEIVR